MERKRNERNDGERELNSLMNDTSYFAYTIKDLRTELKRRNLPVRGLKAELVSDVKL